jgi:hypothetical protein
MVTWGGNVYGTVRNQTTNVNMFVFEKKSQESGTYYEL